MFGRGSKLPISDEERQWVNRAFERLSALLGKVRMLDAKVILPIPKHFPDPYVVTEDGLQRLFLRICEYMNVDRGRIDLEVFPDHVTQLREILPFWQGTLGGCAGLYLRANDQSRMVISVKDSQLKDPLALVATLAHELGHVILLGGELIDRSAPDMEPLTDVLTVFLGLGVFSANTAARFEQHGGGGRQGWSMKRLGYLSEEMYGYALAKFGRERGEDRPEWAKYLSTNVKFFYKRSQSWFSSS